MANYDVRSRQVALGALIRDTALVQGDSMTTEWLFVISLLMLVGLSASIAKEMFKVGVMPEYEKSKMYFAAAVLAFLAFVFMLSMLLYAFAPNTPQGAGEAPGKAIFDACVKIIPPMVTLIIGFYFGSAHERNAAAKAGAAAPSAPTRTPVSPPPPQMEL